MENLKIGNREIGDDLEPYFIADIAANHDGSLDRAYKLIELAKESGANAAKFQNFKAETIVSKNGFTTMDGQLSHQKNWNKSVYEVYQDASLPDEWSAKLKAKCDSIGIEYMTSPYDFPSVDQADKYVNCYKIGSGDITWTEMLEYIAKKNKPILLATGASGIEDVNRAMTDILRFNNKIVLMQCNTNYTADKSNFKYINLNVLKTYRSIYPDTVLGLSDHTFGFESVVASIALGARVIEKHLTDDNSRDGPDHKFSMTPKSWREMVEASENTFNALGDGIKKIESNESETTVVQRRALYYKRNIKAGEILKKSDIFPLRPIVEGSIPPYKIKDIVGKKLAKSVISDAPVKWDDLDFQLVSITDQQKISNI